MTTTITTASTITTLVDMIRRAGHTAPTSEDLHDWAYDIDWSDYIAEDFDHAPVPCAILAAVEQTGSSAADVIAAVEYQLDWGF